MRTSALVVAALAMLAVSCGSSSRCTKSVSPTGDAQANLQGALSGAKSGDVICLASGTYSLASELSLSTDNVELSGPADRSAILDFAGQSAGANGINVTANGFKAANLTVKNTKGDGIRVTGANGVTFQNVRVTWDAGSNASNGGYGLYPVSSQNILIEKCIVSFAADAGIYVGQSMNIIVRNNEVFGNVAGIEIENSTNADVHDNNAHDNTGGIIVFDLPNLPVQGGKRSKIHHNQIVNNNIANFAAASAIVSIIPKGTGVLIISSDENEVHDNTVTGNGSIGIAVASYALSGRSFTDPNYDQFPEKNYVHDNQVSGNGTAPAGLAVVITTSLGITQVEQLVWDGILDPAKNHADGSLRNCFMNNGGASYRNLDAGNNFMNSSTDVGPNTCTGTTLSPVTL